MSHRRREFTNNNNHLILIIIAALIATIAGLTLSGTNQISQGVEVAERALCIIFTDPATENYTCNTIDDTITFIAGTGVTIEANFTENTVMWNATGVGGGNHNLLSATHSDTTPDSAQRGAIIVGSATPNWTRLSIGGGGEYLRSDGTDATWNTLQENDMPASVVRENIANTYVDGNLQTFTDDDIRIGDNTGGQFFTFSTGDISADRVVSFPVLTTNDVFTFNAATQTLTNKGIDAATNTITNIGASEVEDGLINDQTLENTVDGATDEILFWDSTVNALRKTTINNLPSGATDIISEGNSNVEVIDGGTGQVDIDVDGANQVTITASTADFQANRIIDIGTPTASTDAQRANTLVLGTALVTSPCGNGQILEYQVSNSTWICGDDDAGGGSAHNLLSATHSDTTTQTVSRGSLVYGDATPTWNELVVGGANTVLASDGTDVAWTTLAKAHLPSSIAYEDEANTFTNVMQTFTDDDIRIGDNTGGQFFTFSTGDISADRVVSFPVLTTNDVFTFNAATQTLTNKGIDCDSNTCTNIEDADIKAGANIAWSKISKSGSILNDIGAPTSPYGFNSQRLTSLGTPTASTDAQRANTLVLGTALVTSPCANTEILKYQSSNSTWICSTDEVGGGSAHNLLSATHSDTTTQTVSRGSLIVGIGASPTWNELVIGGASTFLRSDGTDATWQSIADTDLPANVVLDDEANTYVDGNLQTFTDDDIRIGDNTGGQFFTFSTGDISADRVVSFPVLTTNDVFTFNAATQTLTNKGIDCDSNTCTNIESADMKTAVFGNIQGLATQTQDLDMGGNDITNVLSFSLNGDPGDDANGINLANADVIAWEQSPAGTDLTITATSTEDFQFNTAWNTIDFNSNPLANSILADSLDANSQTINSLGTPTASTDAQRVNRLVLGTSLVTSPCGDGQILEYQVSNSTWICGNDDGGGGNHNLLSATHSDTTAQTVSRGSLIVGIGASPTWNELVIGGASTFLRSDGTDATWQSIAKSDLPSTVVHTDQSNTYTTGTQDFGSVTITGFDLNCDETTSSCTNIDTPDFTGVAEPRSIMLMCGDAYLYASNTSPKTTIDATNHDYVVCDFDTTTAETVGFVFVMPDNFDSAANLDVQIYFQVASGTAGVCFDVSFLDLASGGTVDGTFTSVQGGCDSSTGTNTLEVVTIAFTSAQHSIDAGDVVFVKLARDVADATDTNANDARFIAMELKWN